MNDLNALDTLARHARRERPPTVDVTDRVMACLPRPVPARRNLPLIVLTAASGAAAAVVAVIASQTWLELQNPLVELWRSMEGLAL